MAASKSGNIAHKSGSYKQQNKTHKHGKHRSNRSLDSINRGRKDVKTLSKKNRREIRKLDRRNKATQLRKNKRDEAFAKKRQIGGQGMPPILVTIVCLSNINNGGNVIESFKECDPEAVCTQSRNNLCHISFPRYKQRLAFLMPTPGDLYATLDAAKVSDTLLFLHPIEDEEDESTDKPSEVLLSALLAHGLPANLHLVQGFQDISTKRKSEVKKQLQKSLERRFPDAKLSFAEKSADFLQLIHQIIAQKKQVITMRERRPHLLAESVQYEMNENGENGTLKITGYLRGQALSVNGLVHIPGSGTYQLTQFDAPTDPHPLVVQQLRENQVSEMDEGTKLLELANPSIQESLESENTPDPMEGEQTWPTEEEMEAAEGTSSEPKRVKVPKGTSAYQAAWIVEGGSDGEDSELGDIDEEDEDEADMDQCSVHSQSAEEEDAADKDSGNEDSNDEEEEEVISTVQSGLERYDQNTDMDDDNEMYHKFQEERMNELFPDEVDTPMDKAARVRFARYRGLKSFVSSTWDPKENLPAEYAKIFQFENFQRTKKKILAEDRDGVMPGWYITLHVANVPKDIINKLVNDVEAPLVVYGLLKHEQKMSLVNVALKRHSQSTSPVKSKEALIFHIGFQRYTVRPIFSTHTNADKHKYERFMRTDVPVVASFYAPLIFPPAPVIVFKENGEGGQELIATGSILSIDPDRIIVKRIVLSGHPFKINKRSVVVRYMFFTREDIVWFKPVELRTKLGRRGHIQEPLGTHGHMKCIFDTQLKSQDTVMMNLYKRVYPKLNMDVNVPTPPNLFSNF